MILRKFGKLILGKATPFQLVSACTLGALLGFTPVGFQAPALWLILLLCLVILNANLFLAGMVGVGVKLASLALMSVQFACGVLLLDGPLEGLFRSIVNAPVLAYCGLEYYSVSGGMALGLVLGLGGGLFLAATVGKLRRTFVSLDEGSEAFHKWSSKGWVKFLTWVLLGAKPNREAYERLGDVRMGNPVRTLGAVFAVGVAALCWAGLQFASTPVLTAMLVGGLERANGATVDLESAELSEGRLTLRGLALADSSRLDRDVFRASELELDVHVEDLLRKRLHIERVRVAHATSGEPRKSPGRRITEPEEAPEPPPPAQEPDSKKEWTLEEVLVDAETVRQRWDQARRWLERLEGVTPGARDAAGDAAERAAERAQQVASDGRRWARAEHLIEETPTLRVSALDIENLEAMEWNRRQLAVSATNLSTHPHLLPAAPSLEIRSLDDAFAVKVDLSVSAAGAQPSRMRGHVNGLDGSKIGRQLRAGDGEALSDGTIDVQLDARWSGENDALDGQLATTLNGTRMKIGGSAETIERLELAIGLGGTLRQPRIEFDQKQLTDALVAAGKDELARRAKGEVDEEVDRTKKKIDKEIKRGLDKIFKRD